MELIKGEKLLISTYVADFMPLDEADKLHLEEAKENIRKANRVLNTRREESKRHNGISRQ